jgi:hypothetical protein
VDFCADAISRYCLPGHLYSFTSLRISGQCIGDDVHIENQCSRTLRIYNAAVDRITRSSIFEESQRISCYYRMTSRRAVDRLTIEDQSPFILNLQKTRLAHYPVLTPVPRTTLETPPSVGTAYNDNALTSSPSSDLATQISRTKFNSCNGDDTRVDPMHSLEHADLPLPCLVSNATHRPPVDNSEHRSCISIVFLDL